MSRPKRRFTTPLGSGAAPSLGSADPRLRRDRAARSAFVPDPIASSADVEALAERVTALEQSDSTAAAAETSEATFEQGDYTYDGTSYYFVSFGEDGNWMAVRHSLTAEDTLTGSGSKPTTLSEFQALTWPAPAP